MNHDKGFRPSSFPALSQCIHFESDSKERDFNTDGTDWHSEMAALIKEHLEKGTVLIAKEGPYKHNGGAYPVPKHLEWGWSLICGYLLDGWEIVSVEGLVPILGAYCEEITHGTIDVLLKRKRSLKIIDWKTGEKDLRSYYAQMDGYIAAVWDACPKADEVEAVIAYVKDEVTESFSPNWGQANMLVVGLYDKWQLKDGPYRINDYCSWCKLKAACPAWLEQAAPALALVEAGGKPVLDVDKLKNTPLALGGFMLALKTLNDLVKEWKLNEALITHLEVGEQIPGWGVTTVKARTEEVPDIEKMIAICEEHHLEVPTIEKPVAGYSYARRKPIKK